MPMRAHPLPLPTLEARVYLKADDGRGPTRLLAMAELIIADAFVIRGIRILKRRDDTSADAAFVVWPAERDLAPHLNHWQDIAHPIHARARAAALAAILTQYAEALCPR